MQLRQAYTVSLNFEFGELDRKIRTIVSRTEAYLGIHYWWCLHRSTNVRLSTLMQCFLDSVLFSKLYTHCYSLVSRIFFLFFFFCFFAMTYNNCIQYILYSTYIQYTIVFNTNCIDPGWAPLIVRD